MSTHTDLLDQDGLQIALVVQPQFTTGQTKEIFNRSQSHLQAIFEDCMAFRWTHVGWIGFDITGIKVFWPCGGKILTEFQDGRQTRHKTRIVTCSNADCQAHLKVTIPEAELPSHLLHLMIKQIAPNIPMLNFLYCHRDYVDPFLQASQRRTLVAYMKAIGSPLGLSHDLLFGSAPKVINGKSNRFSLAFTPLSGVNISAYSFDGLDSWANFLLMKKFEQLRENCQGLTAQILGPKKS